MDKLDYSEDVVTAGSSGRWGPTTTKGFTVTGSAAEELVVVVVECSDCGDRLTFQDHSMDNVRGQVVEFFAVHPHCSTAIDLSNAASLRFPDARRAAP